MKKIYITACLVLCSNLLCLGQARLINVKPKKFKTSSGLKLQGDVGFLEVPENRKNPSSRKIRLKFVHLKSLSKKPSTPVVYLEGGDGLSTWEINSPADIGSRVDCLEVADLILLDRRGASDESLTYIWKEEYPTDFFVSEEKAEEHYQKVAKVALQDFERKKIDVKGYNIEEHARDVNDLMSALDFDKYTLFGFSYGSHIAMTVMKLFPDQVERAILAGADAPNQALNFPRYLDEHIEKIGRLIEQEGTLNMTKDDFKALVNQTMNKLESKPVTVTVNNPLTRKNIDLSIGAFGLGLILRLDIDDANDIPVIPMLLHSVNNGDYSILTYFVQKRMVLALGLPGQGINQQLASGVSTSRWSTIQREAQASIFGNAVNFPFSAVKNHWVSNTLSFDPTAPLKTDIPTLFITGTLDCRTPIKQVEETLKGFSNATHLKVENAGHEQAHWDPQVAYDMIPAFINGKHIESMTEYYSAIKFIKLTGKAEGHPSIK